MPITYQGWHFFSVNGYGDAIGILITNCGSSKRLSPYGQAVKFTKKPLRFFGLIGFSLFLFGLLIAGYLTTLRLLGAIELANRPLLLLGILLMVFGVQSFSIGLVGELIVFGHSKEQEDYEIEEIIE